ncbi:HlyD family secretion protein [Stenomitos frigidus]|uniref:Multidrug resistance protein MdtA-like alpha-helical hairpin domain-containing protein n=1 Tax=Stenomitos frigidus ULC18 TaxID=2107698 RepID=A0A2T1DY73_9CYAN|nr:HlyD family efflux transporter periplasmic adaptor subunit [Stenomitos frigidus]PSB25425.1 hypothetical protein C7B82_23385 [Stenomitos frigidus ULC18]
MTQTLPGSVDSPQELPAIPVKAKRPPKQLLLLPIALVLAGAGYGAWQWLSPADKSLHLSGRIEVYETAIGVKRSGRVEKVAVREGAVVRKGDVLVTLDGSNDQLLQDQLRGAQARVLSVKQEAEQARSEVARAQSAISEVNSQIQEAQLNVQQSQGDTQGRVDQARSQVAVAKAQLAQAEAQAVQASAEQKLAALNRERYATLLQEGAVNQQQFDQAQTTLETSHAKAQAQVAAVEAARQQLSAAAGGLTQTESSSLNPTIRNTQLAALLQRREQSLAALSVAQAQLKGAEARVKDAQAARQQIETQIKDSEQDSSVVSPLDGVVTARSVEPGTVVDSQSKLLTLIDPQTVYLRGFLPEGEIGHVRVGQMVQVFLDSATNKPLEGKVIAIDSQASFTPENIYFQQDRVKQVVGVRISVENPAGCNNPATPYADNGLPCAKQGMPADARILLKD